MENPRDNPNIGGGGRSFNERSSGTFGSLTPLLPEIVAQHNLEREQMNQPQPGQRQRAGISFPDSSEHNHSVNNQRTTEPGTEPPTQPAHASSSEGSHSKGENDPEITAAEKKKPAGKKPRSEVDRNYREKKKRRLQQAEKQADELRAENENFRKENASQRAENHKLKESLAEMGIKLGDATKKLAEEEEKNKEQYSDRESEGKQYREIIQQLMSDIREKDAKYARLNDKYIGLLENNAANALGNPVASKVSFPQRDPSSRGTSECMTDASKR